MTLFILSEVTVLIDFLKKISRRYYKVDAGEFIISNRKMEDGVRAVAVLFLVFIRFLQYY